VPLPALNLIIYRILAQLSIRKFHIPPAGAYRATIFLPGGQSVDFKKKIQYTVSLP
jgi:hypothetical protein